MIAKLLICPSYVQSFHDDGNSYVKRLYHFYCKCKDDHEHFVHTCKYRPYICKMLDGMRSSCGCKNLGPYEIFEFCVQVKYLINCHTYKLCIKSIPGNIAQNLVPLDKCLHDEMTKCALFFIFLIIK